ncbi:midasin-like, partial [Centruroides sculpturatus]|uniref:midasin-like n=1 Tax=Centruroides sculpturatus TaxID=218467 RepID=UPI000C6EE84A
LIITKWPVLKPIVNQIMDIYFMISSGEHDHDISKTIIPKSSSGRLISTRDLLKWCQRIIEDFDLTSTKASLAVFQDAIDCFCKHISSTYERVNLAKSVGTKLNLTEAKIEYFCTKYKPEISISSDIVKIGRVTLMKRKQNTISEKRCSKTVYAHTRQSLALLESVAVAVKNSEPVLLVGETGTGKTSVVQYLADLLGHKLTVINMNQQSDSVDLLGG